MLIHFQYQHCLILIAMTWSEEYQPTNPVSVKQSLLHTKEWKIWIITKKLLISVFHHLSSYNITWLNYKAKSYILWTREYVPYKSHEILVAQLSAWVSETSTLCFLLNGWYYIVWEGCDLKF
jgi:hypothetical protein